MYRTFKKMLLPDMRADEVRQCLEHVLEVAAQEQANPHRPRVARLCLAEPADHLLPIGVRGKTGHFFGIYDCPKHLINACMVPLLWANLIASPACEEGCCGDCADSWLLEYWQDGRFPLLPFEVSMMLISDLGLALSSAELVPQAWAPFCLRHTAQPVNGAAKGTPCQPGEASSAGGDSFRARWISCHATSG